MSAISISDVIVEAQIYLGLRDIKHQLIPPPCPGQGHLPPAQGTQAAMTKASTKSDPRCSSKYTNQTCLKVQAGARKRHCCAQLCLRV